MEILLIIMEDVLYESKYLLNILQLELIIKYKADDLEDSRLKHDFVASSKGRFTRIQLFEVGFKRFD